MKIKKTRKTLLVTIVALLLVGGAGATAYFVYSSQKKSGNSDRLQSDLDQARDLAEKPENKNLSPNSDKPSTPPSTPEPSGKKNVPIIASTNAASGNIYVRGGLGYPVLEDGSCYAILSGPSGQTIQKDTEILQNPASTDCKTVSVPAQELSKGSWKATLHYSSTNYEGASNEVEFTIN